MQAGERIAIRRERCRARTQACEPRLTAGGWRHHYSWRRDETQLLSSPWCNSICIRAALHPSSTPTRLPRWGPGRGGVAPPSHTTGMLGRRALPAGRIAALGATMDLHHGLLDYLMNIDKWPIPVSLSPNRTQLDPRKQFGIRKEEFGIRARIPTSQFQIPNFHPVY